MGSDVSATSESRIVVAPQAVRQSLIGRMEQDRADLRYAGKRAMQRPTPNRLKVGSLGIDSGFHRANPQPMAAF